MVAEAHLDRAAEQHGDENGQECVYTSKDGLNDAPAVVVVVVVVRSQEYGVLVE